MERNNTTDVIYRTFKEPFVEGIVACGFLAKPTADHSQYGLCIDFYSGFLVLSGSGTYLDADGSQHRMQPGSFVQRMPGQTHSTRIDPDGQWLEYFVCFGKPVFDCLCELDLLDRIPVRQGDGAPPARLVARMTRQLKVLRAAPAEKLPHLLMELQKMAMAMRHHARTAAERTPGVGIHTDKRIRTAMERLSTRFQEPVEPHALAASLGMGYESFRKRFHAATGQSPGQYRTLRRMEQAALLLASGFRIKEVAALTGYGDVFSFSKQFRKTKGVSPGRYGSGGFGATDG